MDAEQVVDVVVIGGGPAGENVVERVVRGGLSAAVVEAELLGGECSYWACVPSKAMLRPIDLFAATRRSPGAAEAVSGRIDVDAVLARRDEATSNYDDSGQVEWIGGLPATVLRGHGRIVGPRTVEVVSNGSRQTVQAQNAVVVATGSRATVPPIPGLADSGPWTSRDATSLRTVPARLAIIGGGVVACEMAQVVRGLGADEVTMLVRGPGLLGRMEPFAGELVANGLAAAGIEIRTGMGVSEVSRAGHGAVTLTLSDGATLEADELLVATGRTLNTDDIGLEIAGLDPGKPVPVDDSLRAEGVDGGWLYAVGDANGRNLLTHMGKYQARICGDVIVARAQSRSENAPGLRATSDAVGAPQVVFTDPEACSVGLTEAAARESGYDVRPIEFDIGKVTGAYLLGEDYRGRAKAVVDESRRVLLGVTFVGSGVAELLHSATVAVTAEVPLDRLWHAVPAFPTVSEVWLRLLETYGL
ncbi:MAG TPA: NAD(P)/FAD-dependent oxidoreductase [Jiangellaceae bacterium]|jgi:dihydrolipoamide dehydrogenase|nr:NAD(P)/FAD-dependent oxidoreductase [Jiangellaceae bacterium]